MKTNLAIAQETSKRTQGILDRLPRKLSKLVHSQEFQVDEVVSQSYRSGQTGSYEGGYVTKFELTVTPTEKGLPIRVLEFHGPNLNVQAGDYIVAQIPRYQEKKFSTRFPELAGEGFETKYYDRPFQEKESAIEIAVVQQRPSLAQIKIGRRDRSVDYDLFQEK